MEPSPERSRSPMSIRLTTEPPVRQDSEAWFRALAETTSIAMFVYNADRYLYANRAAAELTGYSTAELLTFTPWQLIHPDFQPLVRERITARLRGDAVPNRSEIKIVTRDGRERWVELTAALFGTDHGEPTGLGTAVDVTERRIAEEALRESGARLEQEKDRAQVTLASIGDGVIRTDAEGLIDYMNPVAERLTGWTSAEACGQPVMSIFQVVEEATGKPLPNPVERCLQEGRVVELPGYAVLTRRDGSEFAIRDSVAPVRDRDGRILGTVLVFKDVTQLRGLEREMIWLARHDHLTGLINRREFEKRLRLSLSTAHEEGRRHALFYLDLDEFKVVNDTCGHLAGDEMLKQVTALLKSRLRKVDTLARLGGDEFGVMLPDCDLAPARRLAERVRHALEEHRFPRVGPISVSAGVASAPRDGMDPTELLGAAERALGLAKKAGRHRTATSGPAQSH